MGKYGIMAISHGSRSTEWVELVDRAVMSVTWLNPRGKPAMPVDYLEPYSPIGHGRVAAVPIVSVFLELVEGRLIQDGIDRLEAEGVTDIIVVPLFVSSGSTHVDEIRYALGDLAEPTAQTEMRPFRRIARVHVSSPIDDDPDIADIVYDKISGLSTMPEREIILLVGHGSVEWRFGERWTAGMEQLAARVRERGGFAAADTATLLPDRLGERLAWWNGHRPGLDVLVAPLFLSEGYFTREAIPRKLDGYRCKYDGQALLPHPLLASWIGRQAAAVMETIGDDID